MSRTACAFYEYLIALDAYRSKLQHEWTDAERCRIRVERLERKLAKLYAPQLEARKRDRAYEGRPLIADSEAWGLHRKVGAQDDCARASCAVIILLLDDLQQRLRRALRPGSKPTDFSFGPNVGRTALALAIFAAANSVRHADEWASLPWTESGHDTSSARDGRAAVSIGILTDALGGPLHFGGHVCREILLALALPPSGGEAAARLINGMREIARAASVALLGSEDAFMEAVDEVEAEAVYEAAGFQFVH